jgi:hypothetical protein
VTARFIAERGIARLVHFTTDAGMFGILASKKLKATKRLHEDEYLEFVFKQNSPTRKDVKWLDHVSLSIEHINGRFFDFSGRWHQDGFWCVIELDPLLMTHDDVHFATTNNIYTGCSRDEGRAGLEKLYAERVHTFSGNFRRRGEEHRPSDPTCPQAEVLYPGEIPTTFMRRIYVQGDDDAATIEAQCVTVGHPAVEVVVDPMQFRPRK